MTSSNEFYDAVLPLNAAEAFELASGLESIVANLRQSEVRALPGLLMNFATKAKGIDKLEVNTGKVQAALDLVATSTVLEASEFTILLSRRPEYNA